MASPKRVPELGRKAGPVLRHLVGAGDEGVRPLGDVGGAGEGRTLLVGSRGLGRVGGRDGSGGECLPGVSPDDGLDAARGTVGHDRGPGADGDDGRVEAHRDGEAARGVHADRQGRGTLCTARPDVAVEGVAVLRRVGGEDPASKLLVVGVDVVEHLDEPLAAPVLVVTRGGRAKLLGSAQGVVAELLVTLLDRRLVDDAPEVVDVLLGRAADDARRLCRLAVALVVDAGLQVRHALVVGSHVTLERLHLDRLGVPARLDVGRAGRRGARWRSCRGWPATR